MKTKLKKTFPKITKNNCIKTSSDSRFFIEDNNEDNKSYIFYDKKKAKSQFFSIVNDKKKKISLLQVDHCLFFDNDVKKCDFILFDDKYFIFVELKEKKAKQRSRGLNKAQEQLRSTINIFRDKIDFKNYNLEAYLCVGKPGIPSRSARMQDLQLEFLEEYGVMLFNDCERVFL